MSNIAQIEESTPIVTQNGGASLLAVIARAAADPSCDVEKMERLLAMHERMTERQAETDFHNAMTDAQEQMRPISADATNPQTKSKYAKYDQLDRALRPIYTRSGFGLSFDTDDSPKADHVRVVCIVSHRSGHTHAYKLDMPVDGKGAKGNDVMTKTHAVGSGTSYGMRYLLKMIFNVAIGEADDDGNSAAGCEPEPEYLDWKSAIKDSLSVADLRTVKGELEKTFGNAIPAVLVELCNERLAEVRAVAK